MSYETFRQWKNSQNNRRPYLSVVIPVVNQAEEIVPTLGAVISQVCDVCSYWELIVVDGGSNDGTVELVLSLALPNVSVIHAGRDSSVADRLRKGVMAARGHYILTTEPKNLAPIEELGRLLPLLERGAYDIALGEKDSRHTRKVSSGRLSLWERLQARNSNNNSTTLMLFRHDAAKPIFLEMPSPVDNPVKEICQIADKYQYKVSRVPVKFAGVKPQ
ncbi:MAG: hypothetical protein Kow0031_25770 [Anaerolineae bacterium]